MPTTTPETESRILAEVAASTHDRVVAAYDPETRSGNIIIVEVTSEGPRIARWLSHLPMQEDQLEAFTEEVLRGFYGEMERIHNAPVTIN
ncbi:MAG: hypothetical protein K9L82_15530 [Chromatiaceae bacterium]|nr:hypothetical protein [Chromatiaceae bacterium]MCF7996535.1 hypothetical protein [Chromatiaceae bacterium]MCF8017323.1 hypothetical protein [Chromatiaceae bacterium]